MSPQPDASLSERGSTRLTWLYIAALSAVALLSLAGQLVIQNFLYRQRSDSTVINVAGRQRMLSQKLTKAALAYAQSDILSEKDARLNEFREAMNLWERTHQGLQQGDQELGLPGANSAVVRQQFANLEGEYSALRQAGEQLLRGNRQTAAVQKLLRHEESFLTGMDAIVSQYEREAQEHVARLQWVERALFALTMGVLLLEGTLVFRPAVRHIQFTLSALEKAGDELRRAKEAAEAASLAKSRLIANTSHELRTPLHAILGLSEQLTAEALSEQQRHQMGVIHSSAAILLQHVTDLLDVAAIEAGKLQLKSERIELHELLAETAAILRASLAGKLLQVELHVDPETPQYVFTDGQRLKQVLLNLGANAIKFTERGSITLGSRLVGRDDKSAIIRFAVSDTGIGIAAEEHASVFEAFTQLNDKRCPNQHGIGLGLSICRHIVNLLGGDLQLDSEVGRGTEFAFQLRLPFAGDETPRDPTAAHTLLLVGRKVLVVDDAPVNLALAAMVLSSAGCTVETADDGRAALEKVAQERFDAVLLDMRLPDLKGSEVAQAIRAAALEQDRPRPPIIALTADGHSIGNLEPELFQALLLKPASRDQIVAAVTGAINGRSSDAPLQRLRGDHVLLKELQTLFAEEAPRLMARIEHGIAEHDSAQVRHAAHQMRGQALQIGATDIADAASALESEASSNGVNQRSTQLDALRKKVKRWL